MVYSGRILGPCSRVTTYRTGSAFQMHYETGTLSLVFPTVQFIRPRDRTRRTTGGSPSFFESMDGLGEMELGADALPGPVGPCGGFLFRSLLLVC